MGPRRPPPDSPSRPTHAPAHRPVHTGASQATGLSAGAFGAPPPPAFQTLTKKYLLPASRIVGFQVTAWAGGVGVYVSATTPPSFTMSIFVILSLGLSASGSLTEMSNASTSGRSSVDPMIEPFTVYAQRMFVSSAAYVRRCFRASRMAGLVRSAASTNVRDVWRLIPVRPWLSLPQTGETFHPLSRALTNPS